jgi:predicted RNase H-like HicB family nuclease
MNSFAERAGRYLILTEGGPPSNYSAWSPDLPGCVATGASIDECEAEMRGAVAFHLEGLAEGGGPIPDGSGPRVYVERTPRPAA